MKKITTLLGALLLATAGSHAQMFMGNPTPDANETGVFAYWNFNSLSITTANAPGVGDVPLTIAADFGAAQMSLANYGGTVRTFVGSTVNAQSGDPAGQAIAMIEADGGEGTFLEFSFDMTNLASLTIDYWSRTTATGYQSNQWSWSSDGLNFTNFGAVITHPDTSTSGYSFNLSTSALDDVTTAYLRYTLNGATSESGNNRIDNITFSATTIEAVPEPSTYALIAIGLGALYWLRRRKNNSDQAAKAIA